MIALADEFAARVERIVGKRFEDVPASYLVSRAETDLLYGESERLIAEGFGPDSDQLRYWKTTLEGDREAVFNLYPDDESPRWLYRISASGLCAGPSRRKPGPRPLRRGRRPLGAGHRARPYQLHAQRPTPRGPAPDRA